MDATGKRRHVFISHHHADDVEVSKMSDLLTKSGYDIRNSSIRAKPANQRRLERGLVKDETIRRLLRMKISWASTVVVLVGKDTHKRPWVNWEIEQANKQGKRIVGVYARGGTESDLPSALKKYASSRIAGWNADSIMDAIDGRNNLFQDSDGSPSQSSHPATTVKC
ncbi:MAG: TIR domain-containing protein [Candidatus Angelobacter sp.]